MTDEMLDRLAIRELIQNWVLWRDAGDWTRFRTVWHDDGRMMATWTQGLADDFIKMSKAGFDKGIYIIHFLGGTTIDLKGDRAVVQTKMTISQRAPVHDVLCDVVCTGRFYDLLEKRGGKWGMVLRQPIYEKDRLDPLEPGATVPFDKKKLESFPVGYRHLAYLQDGLGYPIKMNMPGIVGDRVQELYALGKSWLAGGPADWK